MPDRSRGFNRRSRSARPGSGLASQCEDLASPEEIAELVHATFKAGPDIVVVSQSLKPEAIASTMERMAKALPKEYRVVRLSELRKSRVKEGEKLVVFNDSAGRMHAIYASVDGSVTAGAVNIAEPLLAETPSVIFDTNSKYMFGYDKATFSEALSAAKASGGAETVTDPKELAGKVGSILKGESASSKGAFHPPDAIVDPSSGDAPVDRMLRHLNEVIDEKVTDAGLSQSRRVSAVDRERHKCPRRFSSPSSSASAAN